MKLLNRLKSSVICLQTGEGISANFVVMDFHYRLAKCVFVLRSRMFLSILSQFIVSSTSVGLIRAAWHMVPIPHNVDDVDSRVSGVVSAL